MNLNGIQIADDAFRSLCKKYFVKELSLFGSRARGDNRLDSDIDLLVEFDPNARVNLFDFVSLKLNLEELLGMTVDLLERESLKPRVREKVISEARLVYAN